MRNIWVALPLAAVLTGGLPLLSGCGGAPPKAAKSAEDEIGSARRSISSAKDFKARSEWDMAIAELKQANSKIKDGLAFASGSDKRTLHNLKSEASDLLSACEMGKITAPKAPPKPVVNTQVVQIDPLEVKRKAEEEKKKKDAEEAARRQKEMEAKLAMTDKPAPKRVEDEAEPAGAAGDGTKAAAGANAEGEPAKPQGIGPYPPVSEKSPPLDIIKTGYSGNYCFAYFQIYNKDDNAKRIMGVTVVFKDKDNAAMTQPNMAITVPFDNFSLKDKDPTASPSALTLGSHTIQGHSALQLVGVSSHPRAKDCKRVGIRVVYDDGTSVADSGPSSQAADEPDPDKTKVNFK